ncbi:MAG TPA: hypothetical protein VFB16_14655 [Bauldia sp.]|nr:hypothetical protein [Bauldia sp.]
MESRYEMRQDEHGWTVFDRSTGKTAEVNGVPQHGLVVDDADDLVDLLNRLEIERAGSTNQ